LLPIRPKWRGFVYSGRVDCNDGLEADMSVLLVDRSDSSRVLNLNLWTWRTIVDATKRLDILSVEALAQLEPFCGGLDRSEAHRVAAAIQDRLLPSMGKTDRLLIGGATTTLPDEGKLYRNADDIHLNYSAPYEVLQAFARFCADCDGFDQ
jgi:hypothetical protein